ncbi:MAG: hypothetical protein ACK41G_11920 [Candidatus Thermochlorobacter sp.]
MQDHQNSNNSLENNLNNQNMQNAQNLPAAQNEESLGIERRFLLREILFSDSTLNFFKKGYDVKETGDVLSKIIDDFLKKVCSGEYYYNFKFENAQRCIDFVYEQEGYKKPLVIVCENPVEAKIIGEYMEKMYYSRRGASFRNKFHELVEKRRQTDDVETIEFLSNALKKIVLDKILIPDELEKIKKINWYPYPDTEVYPITFYSSIYYLWYQYCEATEKSYWRGYKEFFEYQKNAGIFYVILREDVAIISKYPKKVHRNPAGRLHNPLGPAVEFGEIHPLLNRRFYYLNGRYISKPEIFERDFTVEEFLREPNEEFRAAMYAKIEAKGDDYVIDFLKLKVIDKQLIEHNVSVPVFHPDTNEFVGFKEEKQKEELTLYHTSFTVPGTIDPVTRERDGKMAFIKFVCPSTGTSYLIYTSTAYKTALEAAKATRPFEDLQDVPYNWTQRS